MKAEGYSLGYPCFFTILGEHIQKNGKMEI